MSTIGPKQLAGSPFVGYAALGMPETSEQEGVVRQGSWAGMRSPVAWALLGLVIERADYGYGLLKRFERDYAELLPIKSDWHVYRALDALKGKSLIEDVPDPVAEHPDRSRQPKPHYRATDEGLRRYGEWLLWQVGAPRRHSHAFARQLAALAQHPGLALQLLEQQAERSLREARAETRSGQSTGRETLANRLVREERRLWPRAELMWLEYARRQFEEIASRAADDAS